MVTEGASPEGLPSQVNPGWQRLPRAVVLSLDLRKLVVAAFGLLLLQGGWRLLDAAFSGPPDLALDLPALAAAPATTVIPGDLPGAGALIRSAGWRLTEPWRLLIVPLLRLMSVEHRGWPTLHALLAILWAMVSWGLVGGVIVRSSLLDLARAGGARALRPLPFSARFAGPLILAPLYPLLAAGLLALVCAGFGLLYWLPLGIGPVLGGILHVIPLLLGLVMALLLVGMVAAWPLMHASVAAECEDTLDALSRSFSYVRQRAAKYVAYVAICGLIGIPALVVVDLLSGAVQHLAAWGVSLATPAALVPLLHPSAGSEPGSLPAALAIAGFWRAVVDLLRRGWVFAYFWTSAASIYVLLRHDVDGTPLSSVSPGTKPVPDLPSDAD
jgi:hypothetical protein